MSSSANVVHAQPPAPPGPASFDRSRFAKGTRMVDTANLTVLANTVTACKVQAASLQSTSLATATIQAFDTLAGNVPGYTPSILLGNTCTYMVQPVFMQGALTIGKPFNWQTPHFSSIIPSQPALNGKTFGQAYPLSGGQVRGYAKLYGLPQPQLATQGTIINLNGGTVGGNSIIYT